MDVLEGVLRDMREWLPTPSQFAGASTVALITAALLTVWGRLYARMLRAESRAAALLVASALQTQADAAAELVAARLKAEADLAAARLVAAAKLLEEKR